MGVYRFQQNRRCHVSARLDDANLTLYASGVGHITVPLQEIDRVELHNPDAGHYVCRIASSGGSHWTLTNRSYLGVGRYDRLDREYAAFVRALHGALARRRGIRYRAGSNALFAVAVVTLIAVGAIVALAAAVIAHEMIAARAGVSTGAAAASATLATVLVTRQVSAKRPRVYDPTALPPAFMP